MKTAERINQLLEYLDVGPVTLALSLGLSRTRIADLQGERVKKITFDVADLICRKYPTISRDWLLTGEGEMLSTCKDDGIKIIATPAEVEQELLREELKMMRQELSLMRKELALLRQLVTPSLATYPLGIASEPTIQPPNKPDKK